MRLEQPWWLVSAAAVFAAAAASAWLAARRNAALVYPRAGELREATPRWKRALVRWTPTALKTAALCLAVLALARPQTISRQTAGPTEGIDILLVLDTSLSMRALDFNPVDRMTAAKNAAREFIGHRLSDRIGIVVFGGDPLLSCPLTLDYEALLGYLDDVEPGMTQSEGTAIGDGIASAVGHLRDSTAKSKVLILLTDGRSNAGLVAPLVAAKTARTYGIKLYAIGTAKRGKALYPVDHPVFGRQLVEIPDDLDEEGLTRLANETDGRYFRATNMAQLSAVYREIDRLEKHEFERPEIVSYTDHIAWLIWPAALLTALEILLGGTVLMKVP